jgi:hypothetical protein
MSPLPNRPIFNRTDVSPPRLSDSYGPARLDALYRRAAADRDRFRERQMMAQQPNLVERVISKLFGQ